MEERKVLNQTWSGTGRAAVAALALVAGGLVGVGCQEYATYPAVATAKGMSEDLNNPGSEAAMVAALQYVATHYPPGTPKFEPKNAAEAGDLKAGYALAIDVPKGMRKSFYERMATEVGSDTVPLTKDVWDGGKLPVYHVTRVWMRFHEGTVDVLRPMPELGMGPDGHPVYQKVTVKLTGGFEPWRVIHARAWEPGVDAAPEPYFLPDIERIDQYAYSQKTAEEQANEVRTSNAQVISAPPVKWTPKEPTTTTTTQAPEPATNPADPN
jgi:hypothetical protein